MSERLKRLRKRRRELLEKRRGRGGGLKLPEDPIEFCEGILHIRPTSYQRRLLRLLAEGHRRIVLRWARQTGKTYILAAALIWYCSTHPGSTALIVAPGLRQSLILSDKIHTLLNRMEPAVRGSIVEKALRTIIRFRNQSQIVALPNSEHLLRGYTAHLVICDEAAFFHNDETIFPHILIPMMATTNGIMIVSSTPWGRRSVYHQLNQDPDWALIHVPWTEALKEGIYSREFIREIEKLRETRPQTFRMEYEAQFIEDVDAWLSQDLLARAIDEKLEYYDLEDKPRGQFYIGLDLAERRDYTALCIIEREEQTLRLIHRHRFPLGTPLSTAIGYIKKLRERWRSIKKVYVDITKHGEYFIEDMHEAGIPEAEGIIFTQRRKQEMAQLLRQRIQERRLRIPYDRQLLNELNIERYTLTKSGAIKFHHPEGTHDDQFWALALAVYAAETEETPRRPRIIVERRTKIGEAY